MPTGTYIASNHDIKLRDPWRGEIPGLHVECMSKKALSGLFADGKKGDGLISSSESIKVVRVLDDWNWNQP